MNEMSKQMEMFDDGGLMDEGGTVDPVSGNDVPPGSNQEEVRDDIPAQLSEGEFVFPADVVRYFGLEKLMEMRQEAKMGLQRMEDMGQMGNSEEAIMPDNLPFDIDDIDMEDDGLEMAQGGVVQAANGTFVQPTPTTPNAGVYYNPAGSSTTGVAAAPMKAASASAAPNIGQAATPVEAGSGKTTMFTDYKLPQAPVPVSTSPAVRPKFLGEVVPGVGGVDYTEEVYVNEAGQTVTFRRYNDGSLKDAQGNEAVIPEGYTIKSEAEKDVGTGPVKVETATVQDDGDGGDNDGSATSGASVSFGGTPDGKGLVDGAFKADLSFTGVEGFKGFLGQGASSLVNSVSGGKYGSPISLSGTQGALLQNIIDPTTKTGVGAAKTLGFNLAFNAEQYNQYITREGVNKVSSRTGLADIVTQLAKIDKAITGDTLTMDRANYLSESIKQGGAAEVSRSINIGKTFDDRISKAIGRDRAKVEGSGLFGTDIGADRLSGGISPEEYNSYSKDEQKAVDDAVKDYVNELMGGIPADDDELFSPDPPSSAPAPAPESRYSDVGDDSGGGGDDGPSTSGSDGIGDAGQGGPGGYGESYGGIFNKGGLAKQMKRSGLASKK